MDSSLKFFLQEIFLKILFCTQVTPSVLKEQAEGYVRAIQWNLHYYYNGCKSWSWYYPHHFAPWITDIKGFANMDLEFEMSKPFLPFEQLLSVLPAASKELLPKVLLLISFKLVIKSINRLLRVT
jgi:5'-3' exoribonuclease 1